MKKIYHLLFLTVIIAACDTKPEVNNITNKAIATAGGELFENIEIQFEFRDREYGYKKSNGQFEYVRLFDDSAQVIRDVLTNTGFIREIDGVTTEVPDSMAVKYSNSINSVIYFALLPYGLNDAAVNKEYLNSVAVKDKEYHKIKVTFNQNGGGVDYQDVFIYWIDTETYEVDYLAYSYETEGGGIRFREAYNERVVNGIRMVDYINYKPKNDLILENIDEAFEKGELQEVSRIESKNIKVNTP